MLISRGNQKLGMLPSFSLPVVTTCPGKTPFCDHFCYGLQGRFRMPNVKDTNERRLEASLRKSFVPIMVNEITKTRSPAFRFHVIGDFYMTEYIHKWIDIASELQGVAFFGSTRSWRCDHMIGLLEELRDMPNVYLKASVDDTDSLEPYSRNWRVWSIDGKGPTCSHDAGIATNCLSCGRCWRSKNANTSFSLRWGHRADYYALAYLVRAGVHPDFIELILSLQTVKGVRSGGSYGNVAPLDG